MCIYTHTSYTIQKHKAQIFLFMKKQYNLRILKFMFAFRIVINIFLFHAHDHPFQHAVHSLVYMHDNIILILFIFSIKCTHTHTHSIKKTPSKLTNKIEKTIEGKIKLRSRNVLHRRFKCRFQKHKKVLYKQHVRRQQCAQQEEQASKVLKL